MGRSGERDGKRWEGVGTEMGNDGKEWGQRWEMMGKSLVRADRRHRETLGFVDCTEGGHKDKHARVSPVTSLSVEGGHGGLPGRCGESGIPHARPTVTGASPLTADPRGSTNRVPPVPKVDLWG
ncbi:hypothetical protein ACOMHN_025252 [Nucella lapillus]